MPAAPVNPPPLYDPDPLDHESREALLARALGSLVMLCIALVFVAGIAYAIWYRFGWIGVLVALCTAGIVLSCAAASWR